MAFDSLSEKLQNVFKNLRSKGRLTEDDVKTALKEVKMAKLMEKKTHTRQFGNIQVQTLEALEKTQTRALSDSAKEFMELRLAPTRERMNVMEGHPSQFTKKQKYRNE